MNRDPILCQTFVSQAKEFFSEFPQVKHEWSIDDDKDHCILDIPEESDSGFPITLEVAPDKILVMASGAHTSFDLEDNETPEEISANVLGLLRDLLSPAMRIHEYLAGGQPYKWAFETHQEKQWITEEYVSLFFWNYFGKRTEKYYQNNILPARNNPIE